jgi:hypothetical protein
MLIYVNPLDQKALVFFKVQQGLGHCRMFGARGENPIGPRLGTHSIGCTANGQVI